MRQFRILIIFLLMISFISGSTVAYDALLEHCLQPYQPVLTIAFGTDNGVFFGAWTGSGGELIQAYVFKQEQVEFYVNGNLATCAFPESPGNLNSITLYPLGGSRWTWMVQDAFDNWHIVKDHDRTVVTIAEYDDNGRLITRLVINRNEPTDSTRWHIFDEKGNIAG